MQPLREKSMKKPTTQIQAACPAGWCFKSFPLFLNVGVSSIGALRNGRYALQFKTLLPCPFAYHAAPLYPHDHAAPLYPHDQTRFLEG